jgi:predicted Zn-dependent protease
MAVLNFHQEINFFMHVVSTSKFTGIIFYLIVLSSMLVGCAVNPVSGKKQLALMSEADEIALGAQSDPQIIAEYGLYPDSNIQRFIREKGLEMARISHRPNLNWQFRVLDSDVINAFAVPGGYVYFTRGILTHMNNEAQFAGVLGHEIGHVTARHSVSQQTQGLLTQLGLMAAIIASPEVAQFANELSQGAQLLTLKFGRDDETQSDELGVTYSSKVGYDAREMAKFFLTLQRAQPKGSSELPEFMSTHPDPGNRFERVTELATNYQKANNLTNPKVGQPNYFKQIEGMVYGTDPRQGFLENGIFYHPELKFQFSTPAGWQYKNSPSHVLFAPPGGDGMAYLTLAKGNNAQAAAQAFQEQHKIQVSESRNTTINGLQATLLTGDQVQQQNAQTGAQGGTVRVVAAFIQHNGVVYELIGAGNPTSFQKYFPSFQNLYSSFKTLSDPARLNIKPERIAFVTVSKASTLQQFLATQNIPQSRFDEYALLNGMLLTDQLNAGQKIKVLKRG